MKKFLGNHVLKSDLTQTPTPWAPPATACRRPDAHYKRYSITTSTFEKSFRNGTLFASLAASFPISFLVRYTYRSRISKAGTIGKGKLIRICPQWSLFVLPFKQFCKCLRAKISTFFYWACLKVLIPHLLLRQVVAVAVVMSHRSRSLTLVRWLPNSLAKTLLANDL